ncbi:MAG: FAD-binding protein [Elusimicrobia bacterium]|nr:FAD-binding protein [Elusimicrobiota bacterium]
MRETFPPIIIERLKTIVGADGLLVDHVEIEPYAHDATERLVFFPEAVVKPRSTKEVSALMRLASAERLPVTPRGGGTGLSGGALPVRGGLVMSLERMNRILEIDVENLMAVVEPGVINETLANEVEKRGLYYPPDPASRGSCMLGGNVAHNAGGPHALKYGVTKDYVLGLEAVLPSGEIINTGGKLLKNVTGYNLTQLLVGSEGTLAVVTQIILKLIPLPPWRQLLYAPFASVNEAAVAIAKIFSAHLVPSACEFMEASAMDIVERRLGVLFPSRGTSQACLLVEFDGFDEGLLTRQVERAGVLLSEEGAVDVLVCDSTDKQREIWRLRRAIGEAVKHFNYKEEDTVVPRSKLPELVRAIKEAGGNHGLGVVCYGHAGDGNLHANIIQGDLPESEWQALTASAIPEIFRQTVALGGQISGEHGIGYVQKNYLPIGIGPLELVLMKSIKKIFDPHGILNPGKIFPDHLG